MLRKLAALAGMMVMLAAMAVPAFAQEGPVTATGVLGEAYTEGEDPGLLYPLTDEQTGTYYVLTSGFVDLQPYVGQRVTIEGVPIGGADYAPPALNVTSIEPAGGDGGDGEVTLSFELAVEGQPPADATFWGQYLVEGATVQLTDPDGDGVYTGSMSGGQPAAGAGFRIVQGTGMQQTMTGMYPGEPSTIIKDFGAPTVEDDTTFSATVSFDETAHPGQYAHTDQYDTADSATDAGSGDAVSEDEASGSEVSGGEFSGSDASDEDLTLLPDTGGASLAAGVAGALLLVGGTLALMSRRRG